MSMTAEETAIQAARNCATIRAIPQDYITEEARAIWLARAAAGEMVYAYSGPYRYTVWDGGLPPDTERRIVLRRIKHVPCGCCGELPYNRNGELACDCGAWRCERPLGDGIACGCCVDHCDCEGNHE